MSDRFVNAKELATALGISVATLWRAVGAGHLPKPSYPSQRSPRWLWADVVAAVEQSRSLPSEAVARRRAAKAAKAAAEAARAMPAEAAARRRAARSAAG